MSIEFQHLQSLLRRPVDDMDVVALIGPDYSIIERDEFYGSVEFLDQGLDLVLKEATWVLPATEFVDPKDLFVSGFHFHREGHEGYKQYSGHFPGGVVFNDSESEVRRKLGHPLKTGGGGISRILKRPLSLWISYSIKQDTINIRFDCNDKVEMVTLFVETPSFD